MKPSSKARNTYILCNFTVLPSVARHVWLNLWDKHLLLAGLISDRTAPMVRNTAVAAVDNIFFYWIHRCRASETNAWKGRWEEYNGIHKCITDKQKGEIFQTSSSPCNFMDRLIDCWFLDNIKVTWLCLLLRCFSDSCDIPWRPLILVLTRLNLAKLLNLESAS